LHSLPKTLTDLCNSPQSSRTPFVRRCYIVSHQDHHHCGLISKVTTRTPLGRLSGAALTTTTAHEPAVLLKPSPQALGARSPLSSAPATLRSRSSVRLRSAKPHHCPFSRNLLPVVAVGFDRWCQ
jgi:hypothetical protein